MQTFSKVFTPSAYLKEVVINWGVPDERLSVIPNAVQIPSSNRQSPEVDLVCVARLVPWKGIFELVRLAVDQGWSLALIGDGPLKNDLDAFLEKQPNSKVEIRGTVPMGQVANEIQRGRVFVLNSSYEGLPHVVLEATRPQSFISPNPQTFVIGTSMTRSIRFNTSGGGYSGLRRHTRGRHHCAQQLLPYWVSRMG